MPLLQKNLIIPDIDSLTFVITKEGVLHPDTRPDPAVWEDVDSLARSV